MVKRMPVKVVACVMAALITAGACGKSSKSSGGSTGAAPATATKSLLPNNGPCDTSLPKYPVGISTVTESPVLSLKDDSLALDAAVKAFNSRGGIGKHCMDLTICDSRGDPNKEVDCARQFVANGVVATLSDVTSFNTQASLEVFEAAN